MQVLAYKDYRAARRRINIQAFLQTDGISPATALSGLQPSVSINGAAAVTTGVGTFTIVDSAKGLYYVELSDTTCVAMATIGNHRLLYDDANTVPIDEPFEVRPNPYLHDGLAQAGGSSTITLQSDASATDNQYQDGYVWIIDGTGAGQQRQITGYVGSTKIATVDQPWRVNPDATSVYVVQPGNKVPSLATVWDATHGTAASGSYGEALAPLRRGTAQAGAAGTITLDAGADAGTDFYKSTLLRIVGGAGAGQARFISAYNGSTKVATISPNWVTNPDNSSVFVIYVFGAIAGATAPTSSENANAVWDALLSAHVAVGSFGAGLRLEAGQYAAIADKFLSRSVGGGADGFPSVKFAMCFLAGKWTDNQNGTITVYDADDTTVLGTINYGTRVRDAISSIDSAP